MVFALSLTNVFSSTLPMRGAEIAKSWDHLYWFLVLMSLFFLLIVVGSMVFFAIRYNKDRNPIADKNKGNHLIEIIWTVVPTILVMGLFVWGYVVYKKMVEVPFNAYEVRAIGKQWMWQFQYDTGRMEINKLYVPVNQPVKVILSSDDVLHSFFIPNFRVKKDVVPGMYTYVWFEATVPGEHDLFCAEYCGTSHSGMIGKVVALEPDDWKAFLKGKKIELPASQDSQEGNLKLTSLADKGKELSKLKGCVACHSADGTAGVGPTYKGLYGHDVELADGSTVKVDDNYLRESIENPQAKIVKGFNPVMPTFKGLLSEEEMNALMAYIKSLK